MKILFSILLMLICWGCKAQDSVTIIRIYDTLSNPMHISHAVPIPVDNPVSFIQFDSTKIYEAKFKYFMDKYTKERNFKEIQRYVDSALKYRELIDRLKPTK